MLTDTEVSWPGARVHGVKSTIVQEQEERTRNMEIGRLWMFFAVNAAVRFSHDEKTPKSTDAGKMDICWE